MPKVIKFAYLSPWESFSVKCKTCHLKICGDDCREFRTDKDK